jgi:hypothetical protein
LLAVVAAVAALGLVAPVGRAQASPTGPEGTTGTFGLRLVPAPGSTPTTAVGRLYVVDVMAAGTSVTRSVDIVNGTGSPLDVAVYAAGAAVVGGRFEFAPGHTTDQLSGWTSVESGEVHVASGATVGDTFTISIPPGTSSGDRTAVVWAEVDAAHTGSGGITLVNRVCVRLYVSVGAGGPVSSDFVIGPIAATRSGAGIPSVGAVVSNPTEGAFDVSGTLTLSDGPGGLGAGPFAVTARSVLSPGASAPITVPFRRTIPRGPWRARLVLTNGVVDRTAAATVMFPPFAAGSTGGTGWLIPTVVIVLLVLVLVGALALLVTGRRRRLRAEGPLARDSVMQ